MKTFSNGCLIATAAVLTFFSLDSVVQAADPMQVTSPLDSVGTYTGPLDHVGATGLPPADASGGYSIGSHARYTKGWTSSNATRYSTGVLPNHPYDPTGGSGIAGQHSPRYFAPGYGYQPPLVGIQLNAFRGHRLPGSEYQFGNRISRPRNMTTHRGHTNAYGGPWQFPGATTNSTPKKFSW